MSVGENNAQVWIEKGKQAYGQMRLAEAAADFEKAVTADPNSVDARLCYGVACSFLYQNGLAAANPEFLNPRRPRQWSDSEMKMEIERIRAVIAEQNATNGARAEENLQGAIELDPRNRLAMEYLAKLYYNWVDANTDSLGSKRPSRRDEARRMYKQILNIYPDHKFANYLCGIIDYEKAFDILRASGYPRPLADEQARRSLFAHISPLLEEASRNLLRALEVDPGKSWPMNYLMLVKQVQAYAAVTEDERTRASSEAAEWARKVYQVSEAEAKAAGRPWPPRPGAVATMTFHAVRDTEIRTPRFPPDPQMRIPPPPPPLF